MNEIVIKKLDDSKETRTAVTKVFVDAYKEQLTSLSRQENKLYDAFYESFRLEQFFGAYQKNKLIGIFALSQSNQRAIKIKKTTFIKSFGLVKGIIASTILKREFEHEIFLRESGFYIEAVATHSDYQGKGVGTAMMKYATQNYDYLELEVVDTNASAISVYKKLGFVLFKEIEVKRKGGSINFAKKLYMYYRKIM